ncbi:hypothetical protein [Verrucomicrobium sp. BvORR106]|uniref:hypothetical protein n=1 Tax=Verrucomicrobium sp. BvORR106 TaxID=1403819 RepID=UPI000570CC0A|nr:hypothetical protein [Verrucomicrobium sp. BvORR106]
MRSCSSLKNWSDRVLYAVIGLLILSPTPGQALPVDRIEGRQGARSSRQDGRQTSRARWRGTYVLPAGAAVVAVGGYRYYRVGPRYYYPYMYGGRTVYIDINVVGGNPVPPPPVGSIEINFY